MVARRTERDGTYPCSTSRRLMGSSVPFAIYICPSRTCKYEQDAIGGARKQKQGNKSYQVGTKRRDGVMEGIWALVWVYCWDAARIQQIALTEPARRERTQ